MTVARADRAVRPVGSRQKQSQVGGQTVPDWTCLTGQGAFSVLPVVLSIFLIQAKAFECNLVSKVLAGLSHSSSLKAWEEKSYGWSVRLEKDPSPFSLLPSPLSLRCELGFSPEIPPNAFPGTFTM